MFPKDVREVDGVQYPPRVATTHTLDEFALEWAGLTARQVLPDDARLVGRVVEVRPVGQSTEVVLADGSGAECFSELLVVVRPEERGDYWEPRAAPVRGDHVVVAGSVVEPCERGVALVIREWQRVVSPPLRPMPEKDTLRDQGFRLRNRHLDLLLNRDARRMVVERSRIIESFRDTLYGDGYLEIDTPLLQPATSTAADRSFRVDLRTVDRPVYLRTSPIYTKRLLAAGFSHFFEISRSFRDESTDATHVVEYSLVEVCAAYQDYLDMRVLAQRLIRAAAAKVHGGSLELAHGDDVVDLAAEWPVHTVHEAVSLAVGECVTVDWDRESLALTARVNGVPVRDEWTGDQILVEMYEKLVEPNTVEPTFYTDFPRSLTPFARAHRREPRLAEKWDLVMFGREIATSYSELVDPAELHRTVTAPVGQEGRAETAAVDEDFLAVIESGVPPCAGLGIGLERIVMTLTGAASMLDVIPFPLVPSHG